MNDITNQNDFSRCHCGGRYRPLVPTRQELSAAGHAHPAVCRLCNAFRYLSDREADLAGFTLAHKEGR